MGLLKTIRKVKQREREIRLLMLGLDNAGKTTVLLTYCDERTDEIPPTVGFNIKTFLSGRFKVNVWDVGGQKSIRSFWRNYFDTTDGLVWVVDSSDKRRLLDCKNELDNLLLEERLSGAPLLVLANKQDLPDSMTVSDIGEVLNMDRIKQSRHCAIFACSVFDKPSITAGIDWIISDIGNLLDVGTHSVRVGWSGHDQPKIVADRKTIPDPESLPEDLFDLLYSRLTKGSQENHPVIATVPVAASASAKRRYYETFFEQYHVPAFFLADTAVVSLFGMGLTSGQCVDMGASHTTVSQISGGETTSSTSSPVGGNAVTEFIMSRLKVTKAAAETIKKSACGFGSNKTVYKLPDGREIETGSIVEAAPRLLLGEYADKATILTGGSSAFAGMEQRIPRAVRGRAHAGFVGAALLSSLSSFSNLWLTRDTYNEFGKE